MNLDAIINQLRRSVLCDTRRPKWLIAKTIGVTPSHLSGWLHQQPRHGLSIEHSGPIQRCRMLRLSQGGSAGEKRLRDVLARQECR